MVAVAVYRQDQEKPDYTLTWRDSAGALIDFSTGYTFELSLVRLDTGASVLTKTSGITGAASAPNITVVWTASQLAVSTGPYKVVLRARHTASGLDRHFAPGSEPRIDIIDAVTAVVPADGSGSDLADHLADTSDAHDASAISVTPFSTIAATTVQAALEEIVSEAGVGGGAPTDATYLVTTANGSLSAEVVVGATPGGELGGTWASPTVDATHSGSSHAAVQAAAEATAASALATHEADTSSVHGITDTTALYRSGGTDVAVADGGTGASTAAGARTNLDVDQAGTAASLVASHEADTTSVHGIADTSALALTANVVTKALFDANTILTADSDNTPQALTVAEQRLVGRITAGVITALTAAQVRTLINVEDGATADQSAAEILAALLTVDGSGSGLDADLLDGVSSGAFVQEADTSTASMQFVIDEDDMTSNSATKVPTQQSVKAYVDAEVAGVGGGGASFATQVLYGG